MGLFRRGAKLLRLGGGLRDCCCRPEKPAECWCPDWCRYYWDWSGTTLHPSVELLTKSCELGGVESDLPLNVLSSFGFLGQVLNQYREAVGVATTTPSEVSFFLKHFVDGYLSAEAEQELFGSDSGSVYGVYYTLGQIRAFCEPDASGVPSLFFDANWEIQIRAEGIAIYEGRKVTGTQSLPAASGCVGHVDWNCDPSLGGQRLHPSEDVVFEFSESGITANGTVFDWSETDIAPFYPLVDNTSLTDLWRVSGDYPLEATLTLRSRESCIAYPCDCTQSLSGMIVTFEGQEFTYGQLDSFFNAGTWWEETSAGVFRRRDTESCDGSLNHTVKQATIECTQIDGVDTWVCYLDHTCEERDDLTCPAPPDAGRIQQWTGIFECDEDGKPTGSPGSLEVDSETTTGTPTAECVDALTVPSISISAPP